MGEIINLGIERNSFETDAFINSRIKDSPQLKKIHLKVVTGAQEGPMSQHKESARDFPATKFDLRLADFEASGKNIENYVFPQDNQNLKN
jgi:hypothetical protein